MEIGFSIYAYPMEDGEGWGVNKEQFAIDYNCSIEDFQNKETLVTVRKSQEGARKFEDESFLSILSYRGKVVINAAEEILPWCDAVLKKHISAEWCFEAGNLI